MLAVVISKTRMVSVQNPYGRCGRPQLSAFLGAHAGVKVKVADITNAYLQGKPMERILLYRMPKGEYQWLALKMVEWLLRECLSMAHETLVEAFGSG